MDEILVANYILFDDVVRGRLRPVDRRRGLGHRLLPAREPRAQARAFLLAHRLRRLPAHARRRRARGDAHRRLQRRDDRARRAFPSHPRPFDLRRQPRRHRARRRSARGSPRSATGPRPTSTSPATSPASTRPTCRPRRPAGASSATARRAGLHRHGRRLGRRRALLRKVIDAYPAAQAKCPPCGWSWWPVRASTRRSCPHPDGLEIRAYVHELYRHLAACDLAVVQGGLTTTHGAHRQPAPVPLLPAGAPLRAELPCPPPPRSLRRRAPHGLRRHRPGRHRRRIAAEIGRRVDYRPVETDGASRAAARIAEML